MPSKLDELLDGIDPQTTVFEIERRSQEALMTIEWPETPIQRFKEFEAFMSRVLRRTEREILNLSEEVSGGDPF